MVDDRWKKNKQKNI